MTQTTSTADEIDFQAAQWLLRHDAGLAAPELAALHAWLAADARHQHAWDALARTDALLAALPAQRVAAFSQAALAPEPASRPLLRRLASVRLAASGLPRGALAGGCLLLCGLLAWPLAGHLRQPGFQHDYSTARGQFATQILPDGSRIELDSGSAVDVALYRDRRSVRLLRGQAMFHVHADPARPFQVVAGAATATVLGTHFSVRHVGSSTQVSVAQGTVRVEGDSGNARAAVLQAGDAVTVTPQGVQALARVNAQAVGNWRTGRLDFEDATLAEALAEFERYGDTGLVLGDPSLAGLRLNGSFDAQLPAQFAAALPLALPVRLQRQDGKLHILAR